MQPRRGRLRAGLRLRPCTRRFGFVSLLLVPPRAGKPGPLNHIFGPRKMRTGTSPGVTVGINMIVDVQCLA